MHMYWVYDLPNWLFGVLTVLVFVGLGLAGLFHHTRLGAAPSQW